MKKYHGFVSIQAYLKYLLAERRAVIQLDAVSALQDINHEINRIAKKLKIDYYAL